MDLSDLQQLADEAKDSPSAAAALLPALVEALSTLADRVDTLERSTPAESSEKPPGT